MSSTTTSDEILSIRNLNLVFRMRYYEHRSVRDFVISAAKSPWESLVRGRDQLHVLKDLSLSIRRGDRLALIGVNGAGKTSLCRCISGMLHPASGEVNVTGQCRAIFSTSAGIIPELTGRENARLLARFLYPRESRQHLESLVDEALEFTELEDFLSTPYETYSQGMKARLCLSVITARSADLLILDEVYDNTDQFFRKKMTARLRKFIDDSGAAIFVSHSPSHIRELCNRAVVLEGGKVAFDGSVDDALAAYESFHHE